MRFFLTVLIVLCSVALVEGEEIENPVIVRDSTVTEIDGDYNLEKSNFDNFDPKQNVLKKQNEQDGKAIQNGKVVDIDLLNDAASCIKAGKELSDKGLYFQARKVFHKALGYKPNSPEINNLLGRTYFLTSENLKAKMFLKTAIAIKPDYADAYYNLGDVYFREGDLREAMNNFKTAIGYNEAYRKKTRHFFGEDFIPLN